MVQGDAYAAQSLLRGGRCRLSAATKGKKQPSKKTKDLFTALSFSLLFTSLFLCARFVGHALLFPTMPVGNSVVDSCSRCLLLQAMLVLFHLLSPKVRQRLFHSLPAQPFAEAFVFFF